MDVLSDVLRTVRLTGAVFFPMETSSPWADEIPAASAFAHIVLPGAQQVVSYHIVTEGGCWAALRGGSPIRLEAGDILVIKAGEVHSFKCIGDGPLVQVDVHLSPRFIQENL